MSAVPKPKLELIPMREADIDAVTAIEQRAHPFPWTRGNFVDSLKAGHSAWVFREGGALVGYGVLMMTVDEAELLDITVVPECQRRGLGGALLNQLFDIARSHGATRMLLEVRTSNESGLALYRRFGFAEIGRRRAYYHGKEDAIVMARDL
jgi:[ribosomal protein S18]-alanine N-acetyltransferase